MRVCDALTMLQFSKYSNDGATTGGFLQSSEGVTNGPRTGQLIHRQKFHPLDMANNGQAQGGES